MSSTHALNVRTRGWLRHIWDKAVTQDDWSSQGEPLAWWDRHTTPPMCSFPRFDLSETSYALPLMADQTPAWREVYTRIADELVGRYATYWGAIDWLTYIGHSPHQDNYPPEWLVFMPEHMRGRYDPPGWTANGSEPWGLQPDPIGADGNLFFRGFFNLLLGSYSYVSGDNKWEKPFEVTGYNDRMFHWTQHSITEFIADQWAERPQGAQCENTKIWPYCLSAAGLSLQLHDKLFGGNSHWVYDQWIEFAKKHFTQRNAKGDITSFAFYYDPLEKFAYTPPQGLSGYSMLAPLLYLYPQAPQFGLELYEAGVNALGWNNRTKSLVQAFDDPRWVTMTMMIAREVGDVTTERRMKSVAEQEWGPDFFNDDADRFAWGFGLDEPHPRGQLNGLMILGEIGEPGAWTNIYTGHRDGQFDLPSVEGVDFPSLGISTATNDTSDGTLHVETYAATANRRGAASSWKVSQLRDAKTVQVYCNDQLYNDWGMIDDHTIEINSTIDEHRFRVTGTGSEISVLERGRNVKSAVGASLSASSKPNTASTKAHYKPAAPPSCSCC